MGAVNYYISGIYVCVYGAMQPIGWEKFEIKNTVFNMGLSIRFMSKGFFRYSIECNKLSQKYEYCLRYKSEIMFSDSKWDNVYIFSPVKWDNLKLLIVQAFYTHAVQHHIIQFHSSLISHQNSGLMFLGPSGIGKTTQAELWNQYRDALIINGDIVFVQETEKNFLGWGTPWHGSSSYCENTSVPLRAMVVLKQAKENSIRELVGFEKVSEVSNHVFYPQWLENGMELCLETLDHLLTAIPVYELSCRPDEDAVRMTEETIFGT